MMLFARPPELRLAPVDLGTLVDELIAEVTADAQHQGTTISRPAADGPVVVSADGGHLAVAVKSLVTNALEALGAGGRIEISVHHSEVAARPPDGGPWVEIQVADTGPGIPPEVRRHLFDPYFSGREAGRGLGLGLSKCWRIVKDHGGEITVDSQPQQGTTFTIRLPGGCRDSHPGP
jgi:signal transduction histidine kinase